MKTDDIFRFDRKTKKIIADEKWSVAVSLKKEKQHRPT